LESEFKLEGIRTNDDVVGWDIGDIDEFEMLLDFVKEGGNLWELLVAKIND
jgi:hypothetical protein